MKRLGSRGGGIHFKPLRQAFTLAEVLITLAIIGVVAAMTIPALISNINKKDTAVKLSQIYSVVSNALKMAQVEHGDFSVWSYHKFYDAVIAEGESDALAKEFAETYLLPYLKVSKVYYKTVLNDIGFGGYYFQDGNPYVKERGRFSYLIELSNGVTLYVGFNGAGITNDDGSTSIKLTNPIIFCDINGGKNPPNIIGKDFFMMTVSSKENKLVFYEGGPYTREIIKSWCKKENSYAPLQYCGALIQYDGWKIKDDYPWD